MTQDMLRCLLICARHNAPFMIVWPNKHKHA